MKYVFILLLQVGTTSVLLAQNKKEDSLQIVSVLQTRLSNWKNIDWADPKVQDSGMFYKTGPYIVYRGADKDRAWKDFANYNDAKEKKDVDEVCLRINRSLNDATSYKIEKYFTQAQSEGIWHILLISYSWKGIIKKTAYAFLKVNGRFGIGDID